MHRDTPRVAAHEGPSIGPPSLEGPEALRARLRDGTMVVIRRIHPDDKDRLLDHFRRLSPESRYQRFLAGVATLSDSQLRFFTEIDHVNHEAWIALDVNAPAQPILGVARYVRRESDPAIAEVALAVVDTHQGRGLGSLLLALVSRSAAAHGIETFRAYTFDSNIAMCRILGDLGAVVKKREGPVLSLEVAVPRDGERLPDTPTARVFRAIARSAR
jgi:GNAT superfamily N-acetyltransferase